MRPAENPPAAVPLEGTRHPVEELGSLAPFIVILLAFYLLVIRPARMRQRQQLELQSSLAAGQKVMTTSGLVATISSIEDDEVLLEAAPGVVLRWARPAIARVLVAEDSPDEAPEVAAPEKDASGGPVTWNK